MKTIERPLFRGIAASFVFLGSVSTSFAYDIKYSDDKSEAKVVCDNGTLAGTFLWNGSRWSNGVNSGTDINVLAQQQVALNGSSCK